MSLVLLLIVFCFHESIAGNFFSRAFRRSDSQQEETHVILPKVQPHPDTHYLLMFVGDNHPGCMEMEPQVRRLENDLKTKVKRLNVMSGRRYHKLFETVGGNESPDLPFFYNRRTGQLDGFCI